MEQLSKKIEAVLFWKAEPVSVKKLSEWLKVSEKEIAPAVDELKKNLSSRGIVLLHKEGELMLGTAPELSSLIEALTKEELNRDLGKAGIETLAIVLYYGPITRAEIDYIRGVNSTFILRGLLVRGLVERIVNATDQRSFLYKPTFDLLSHLGITDVNHMPEYETVRAELEAFKAAQVKAEEPSASTEESEQHQ